MDKYYTPKIEEFYIGFEYEINEEIGLWSKKYEWIKSELSKGQMCQCLNWLYFTDNNSKYRVKYLDKEDIESLGWERNSLRAHQLTRQIYNKDNWMLLYNSENHKLSLTVKDPSLNLEMMIKLRTTEVFNITIKNKSELIKLLKQLGIG